MAIILQQPCQAKGNIYIIVILDSDGLSSAAFGKLKCSVKIHHINYNDLSLNVILPMRVIRESLQWFVEIPCIPKFCFAIITTAG